MTRTNHTVMRRSSIGLVALLALGAAACQNPAQDKAKLQTGYRGTAMEQVYQEPAYLEQFAEVSNRIPAPVPPAGGNPPGPLPWRNVQVLNDISVSEFNRTMIAMSTWGAGTGNCAYCHNVARMWDDTLPDGRPIYTKLVARRMLQMTRHINANWSQHVGTTGVTCYTCHAGQPVPQNIWFYTDKEQFQRYYLDREGARVITQTVAPGNHNRSSVKQTEWTYGVMMNMSNALNVNCTYCHNSRAFSSWTEAPPARVKAYHAISMLRDVNSNFLSPLQPVYPDVRLGRLGDAPKAECATCHQGAYKPLYGAQMVKDYPALWGQPMWGDMPFPQNSLPPGTVAEAASQATTAAIEAAHRDVEALVARREAAKAAGATTPVTAEGGAPQR